MVLTSRLVTFDCLKHGDVASFHGIFVKDHILLQEISLGHYFSHLFLKNQYISKCNLEVI